MLSIGSLGKRSKWLDQSYWTPNDFCRRPVICRYLNAMTQNITKASYVFLGKYNR